MNRRLLWKLCGTLALGTLVLFWVISFVGSETERQMSFIDEEYQQTLKDWGRTAEAMYQAGNEQGQVAERPPGTGKHLGCRGSVRHPGTGWE